MPSPRRSQGGWRRRGIDAALKIMTGLPALGFLAVGLAWWIAPQFIATQFRMDLLTGLGLSTQIADLASFFLMLGSAILIGLVSADRVWLYPPILLLGLAVVGRLIAWRFHGADLAIAMLVVEAIVIALLLLNVRHLRMRQA